MSDETNINLKKSSMKPTIVLSFFLTVISFHVSSLNISSDNMGVVSLFDSKIQNFQAVELDLEGCVKAYAYCE